MQGNRSRYEGFRMLADFANGVVQLGLFLLGLLVAVVTVILVVQNV